MKVLDLQGYDSLAALNVYSTLLLGLNHLPAYRGEAFESFLERVQELEPEAQEKIFREAALFVKLERDEVEALVTFIPDANGVPMKKPQLKSMKPDDILNMIVAVCMEIAKFNIKLLNETEKKN